MRNETLKLSSLALACAVGAAPALAGSMSDPVTPRDVTWYMANPGVLEQTLRVCHSNAAYMRTPDCANAESAGAGLMGREYRAHSSIGNMQDPAYWSANPMVRSGIIAQCLRNGPGDELVRPYCHAAAVSKLNDARRQ